MPQDLVLFDKYTLFQYQRLDPGWLNWGWAIRLLGRMQRTGLWCKTHNSWKYQTRRQDFERGGATDFDARQERENVLEPQPKFTKRWGARGSGGETIKTISLNEGGALRWGGPRWGARMGLGAFSETHPCRRTWKVLAQIGKMATHSK